MIQSDYNLWMEIRRKEEQATIEAEREFNKILREIYFGGISNAEKE